MRLGDICTKIGSGATPRGGQESYKSSGIPIIRSQNVLDWSFKDDGLAYIDGKQADALSNVEVLPGDVLLNITGDSVARACMVPSEQTPARVNQHVAIVRHGDKLSPTYLLAFLQGIKPRLLSLASSGATRKALTKSVIENLEIELPDRETQNRVSSVIDCIQQKIVINARTNGYLFDLAATQFAELVIQESTEIKLGEIVELEDSKRIPLNSRDRAKRQGPYPYYGAASVMDHVDDYLFDGIRVLLGEDGTVITDDGHPVLQYVWGKYWVNNHAHVLKASGPYSLESIYIALAAASASELVTGAVQPKINQKNLRNLTLDMPSPGSLAYLETVFASYRASVEESRRLTELRDTLLPKLMSDEIDVSRVELTPPNSHLA
ncbi:restriction endonuclease subunit S [Cryptobacterium curtum]